MPKIFVKAKFTTPIFLSMKNSKRKKPEFWICA